jgi:hypothetical protein
MEFTVIFAGQQAGGLPCKNNVHLEPLPHIFTLLVRSFVNKEQQ